MIPQWLRAALRIGTPRVAAWKDLPWYRVALLAVAILSASVMIGIWGYDSVRYGGAGKGPSIADVDLLQKRIADLERQLASLRANASAGSELQIARTTLEGLARQVKTLQTEKSQLQEDLVLFEKLASTDGNAPELTINGLHVEPDAVPGQYRYRFLAAAQGGKKGQDLAVTLQVIVAYEQSGKRLTMVLPAKNDANKQNFVLNIRHFRRVDGTFLVPDGARVISVEVRLARKGAANARQSVNL